jgi:hypothetical protein
MREIVLLVQPPPGDVSVEEFCAYVKKVVEILEKSVPVTPIPVQEGGKEGRQVIVEIEIPKCEGWLKMSAYPSMDGLPSQHILPQIAGLAQPRALSRIKFQLWIDLWGFQGPSANFS